MGFKVLFKLYSNSQRGVSIMLAVFILSFLLAISMGISTILVRQIKIMREIGYSVIAFYAADAGIEVVLYEDRSIGLSDGYTTSTVFVNDASYEVEFHTNDITTITSIGSYKNTKRAIETRY
ncbi:MAG: hypothetical protein ACKKMO_03360 [Candidatus Nealsonbacteria bacterium]